MIERIELYQEYPDEGHDAAAEWYREEGALQMLEVRCRFVPYTRFSSTGTTEHTPAQPRYTRTVDGAGASAKKTVKEARSS